MQFQAKTHPLAGNFTIRPFSFFFTSSPSRPIACHCEQSVAIPIAFSLTTPLEGFATASRAGFPNRLIAPSPNRIFSRNAS